MLPSWKRSETYEKDRRRGGDRERIGREEEIGEIDKGNHTQERLAPDAGFNCRISVTGCSTRTKAAIATLITITTTTTITTKTTTTTTTAMSCFGVGWSIT